MKVVLTISALFFASISSISRVTAFSVPPPAPPAAMDALTFVTTTAVSTDPAKAVKNDLTQGQQLFGANCAFCHLKGMNFLAKEKDLSKQALEQYLSLDNTELENYLKNQEPHNKLPLKLKGDQDYTAVTSYVLDQALNDKW